MTDLLRCLTSECWPATTLMSLLRDDQGLVSVYYVPREIMYHPSLVTGELLVVSSRTCHWKANSSRDIATTLSPP